ncbi:MAG: ABC transporter ATP-binding protein, partial [Phototrophicales bacterium]|nr:ABC transporter ATP-binding protein [Phototrophicales bacterium]
AHVLGLSPYSQGEQLRKQTGVLTETPALDERLTATQNLTIFADLYGVPRGDMKKRVADMLAQFDLSDRAEDKVGGFSKGMKQRLAIARAFLHRPRLLFLDEPTSSLDPISTRAVHDMIRHISKNDGATVFICTHNLTEAQRLCHRLAVLEKGHLVAIGTARELAEKVGMSRQYHIEVAPHQVAEAQSVLEMIDGVTEIIPDGEILRFSINKKETLADLLTMLVNRGVRLYEMEAGESALEDIYFALHNKAEGVSS